MKRLQQTPGTISLHVDDENYVESDANFVRDSGVSVPALPDGITQRIYEQDARHALSANNSVVDGGPMPWPEGDAILANFDAIVAAKSRRETGFDPRLDMGGNISQIIGA